MKNAYFAKKISTPEFDKGLKLWVVYYTAGKIRKIGTGESPAAALASLAVQMY